MKKIQTCPENQSGYVLFLVMLLIGSLGLYLTYQFGSQKIKTQSWQVQKTATEISYWMDIERNYIMDNDLGTTTNADRDQLNALTLPNMIANNYLPYGQYRPVTFQSPGLTQVSEFLCSPLPGVNADEGSLTLTGGSTTCAIATGAGSYTSQHCSLDNTSYYSCGNAMTAAANLPTTMRKAQYYINGNYISLGNYTGVLAGLGLILRTPGPANPLINYSSTSGSGQMGQLPTGSTAQTLISLLPTSAFNVYSTTVAGVNDIGIGTYLLLPQSSSSGGTTGSTVIKNDRYSKIVDMGLVQAGYGTPSNPSVNCCGWNGDAKTNNTGLYNGGMEDNSDTPQTLTNCTEGGKDGSLLKNSWGPATCIKINMKKYGPGGTEGCKRVDILYTPFDTAQKPNSSSVGSATWYMNYDIMWKAQDTTYNYIWLGAKNNFQYYSKGFFSNWLLSNKQNSNTFFIYLVRCTRDPP